MKSDEIDGSKCYINKLPEDLLLIILDFNTKVELNEMKKVNRSMHELISMKRKKLIFAKRDIPFDIFKLFLTHSPLLEELHFKVPNIIKSNDVFAIEQLNLVNLRVFDVTALNNLTVKALIRFIRRCKNISDIRINCGMNLSADIFYCLRESRKLDSLSLNSPKILRGNDLEQTYKTLSVFSKHISHYKLKSLSIYELNGEITTAYCNNPEVAESLENLSFSTVSLKDGLDVLNDLVFFTNLKRLAICYHDRD